jgi:hypothetical protein
MISLGSHPWVESFCRDRLLIPEFSCDEGGGYMVKFIGVNGEILIYKDTFEQCRNRRFTVCINSRCFSYRWNNAEGERIGSDKIPLYLSQCDSTPSRL